MLTWLALLAVTLVAAAGASGAVEAATTERVVTDRFSGLAIDGFDPVDYFVEHAARQGRPEFEYRHAGVTWRFRNEGNRAAFAERPQTYSPGFGGYDPVGIARGITRPGHPELFAIHGGRLLLFFSEEARRKFYEDPDGILAEAQAHWPTVRAGLIP